MRALVTGVAGFIGSHLAERVVALGWSVRGVDALTDYYSPEVKRDNLRRVSASGVEVIVRDLLTDPVDDLVADADVVFHLAAQPGVRASWTDFGRYLDNNVTVTQRLLQEATTASLTRFVLASSSSVYGQVTGAVTEQSPTRPFSPYGVTKLAAEALCGAYAANFDVPTVSLRLFTVYGPRQRPDMAFHRIIDAGLRGEPFTVFGDGSQQRSFTYVDDVVDAAIRSATGEVPAGTVLNVSGGTACSLAEVIEEIGRCLGRPVAVRYSPVQAGDVTLTDADPELARELLDWKATVPVDVGVALQVQHMSSQR